MNCDETIPLLPLLALDEVDGDLAAGTREHLEGCARCAERLAELLATRRALDLVTVPEAPPLAPLAPSVLQRQAPRLRPWTRAAAAAALLLLAGGAGFVGGRLGAASAASASAPSGSTEEIPATVLTETLLAFDLRLSDLEARHERDLLALARAVDRQQSKLDRGVAQQIDLLARATHAQFISARSALDDVARQIPAELVKPGEH